MVQPYSPFLLQHNREMERIRENKQQFQQQQAVEKQGRDIELAGNLSRGVMSATDKQASYKQALQVAQQYGVDINGMPTEYTKEVIPMLEQMSAMSPASATGAASPSSVREFEYVQGLDPAQQQEFMNIKRAQKVLDLGGSFGVLDPQTQEISQTYEKGLKPAEQQARVLEREKTIGKELLEETPEGLQPEAGSPEAYKRGQEEAKLAKEEVGKERWASDLQVAGATVVRDADRIFELIGDSKPLERVALAKIPGSESNAILARIDSMKSNVGLDKLVKIKQSGAGLGQVPQSQLDLLSNTLGAFNIGQKNEDLKETVKRIQTIYNATAQNRKINKQEAESVGLKLPNSFFKQESEVTFEELWGE